MDSHHTAFGNPGSHQGISLSRSRRYSNAWGISDTGIGGSPLRTIQSNCPCDTAKRSGVGVDRLWSQPIEPNIGRTSLTATSFPSAGPPSNSKRKSPPSRRLRWPVTIHCPRFLECRHCGSGARLRHTVGEERLGIATHHHTCGLGFGVGIRIQSRRDLPGPDQPNPIHNRCRFRQIAFSLWWSQQLLVCRGWLIWCRLARFSIRGTRVPRLSTRGTNGLVLVGQVGNTSCGFHQACVTQY